MSGGSPACGDHAVNFYSIERDPLFLKVEHFWIMIVTQAEIDFGEVNGIRKSVGEMVEQTTMQEQKRWRRLIGSWVEKGAGQKRDGKDGGIIIISR